MAFVAALKMEELWDGEMKAVEISGHNILLIHLNNEVRAFKDCCVHQRVPLSKGFLDRKSGVLTCCAHQWEYDALTGQGINPADVRLDAYPVRIFDGVIYVEMDGLS